MRVLFGRLPAWLAERGERFTVHSLKRIVNCQLSTVNYLRRKLAFSLIELLIVVTLLGVVGIILGSAYLSFEEKNRVKQAALKLKNDFRLVQNKALTGDKRITTTTDSCDSVDDLIGWYVKFDIVSSNNSYIIAGVCKDAATTNEFVSTATVKLPGKVLITQVQYVGVNSANLTGTAVSVLYRPLGNQPYFFNGSSTPPFTITADQEDPNDDSKLIDNPASNQLSLTITLEYDSNNKYEVAVSTTGEISEKKI